MKKIALAISLALLLVGCSTNVANKVIAATNTYDNAVQNFVAAAAAVNGSIALTSQTVGPYCLAAQAAGKNLVNLVSPNQTAITALNTVAAALNQYCIALPTDIQGAVVTLTNAAVAAKTVAQGGS